MKVYGFGNSYLDFYIKTRYWINVAIIQINRVLHCSKILILRSSKILFIFKDHSLSILKVPCRSLICFLDVFLKVCFIIEFACYSIENKLYQLVTSNELTKNFLCKGAEVWWKVTGITVKYIKKSFKVEIKISLVFFAILNIGIESSKTLILYLLSSNFVLKNQASIYPLKQ